jgi:transposase InsO family protein
MVRNPFHSFKTSPKIIQLGVMMYARFPLSLRNVEDLLHKRGIDICHESFRLWVDRLGTYFAHKIRKSRSESMRRSPQWHRVHRPDRGSLGVSSQGQMDFSRPGTPTDNAHIESFNGSLRDECLNINWFASVVEAKRLIEAWRRDYNERWLGSFEQISVTGQVDSCPSDYAGIVKGTYSVHLSLLRPPNFRRTPLWQLQCGDEQQETDGFHTLAILLLLTMRMQREGFDVARCTVRRLMKALGLQGVRRGKPHRTTYSDKSAPCPRDRVNRNFKADAPNQLWVSDFTYVSTWAGFAYVAFVIDVFARRIVGWRVSRTAHAGFVLDALEQALHSRRPLSGSGLVHHSDRGSQYVSIRYTERLAEAGLEPSVGSVGDSYDNALAETINGLYKAEVIWRKGPWKSADAVEYATLEWVD